MANPDTINYSHGDTGDRPADGEDFQSGDVADPQTHDWLFYTIPRKIDQIINRLNILDSNGDGVVDEADFANDANASTYKGNDIDTSGNGVVDKADFANDADASTYKGNDIDTDGDGVIDQAATVTGTDGTARLGGQLPTYQTKTDAANDPDVTAGTVVFVTATNELYVEDGT